MVRYPVFLRLEIHADRYLLNLLANSGNLQSITVRILGDFPSFLSELASNNAFIKFKLVKMWLGGAPHVVVGI